MAFVNNHVESSGLMPDGDFEFIVAFCGYDTTKGGTEYINVELKVRDDVDQSFKNKRMWCPVWKSRETGEWNMKRLNSIANACGIAKGESYDLEDLIGKCLCGAVRTGDKYNSENEKENYIAYFKTSKVGSAIQEIGSAKPQTPSGFVGVASTDDDLPF